MDIPPEGLNLQQQRLDVDVDEEDLELVDVDTCLGFVVLWVLLGMLQSATWAIASVCPCRCIKAVRQHRISHCTEPAHAQK